MSPLAQFAPQAVLRRTLIAGVRAVFHDKAQATPPVMRSDNALFARDSVIWRVHGDVTTMMIGGVTALLLQMLHPSALAGVWEHSVFRDDMPGRLRRTARFIALTTYADRVAAEAAIAQVNAVHVRVRGRRDDGVAYGAGDPDLLAWVHVCETIGFLDAWIRYAEPGMSRADQDMYVAQAGVVARALGADPVPETRADALALIAAYRPQLVANDRSRAVAQMILSAPAMSRAAAPAQALVMAAAVDLLPAWASAMHDRRVSGLGIPIVRGGTMTMAASLRWAFAGLRNQPQRQR